uniref:Insc_C domain-containing protein n=1 Tax=Steinernema glaseri TaxID=37863 RepID=A0A1I8AU39_9BILA
MDLAEPPFVELGSKNDRSVHPSFGHLRPCQQQWLSELAQSTELECMSILYAKSLLASYPNSCRTADSSNHGSTDVAPNGPAKPIRSMGRISTSQMPAIIDEPDATVLQNLPGYISDSRSDSYLSSGSISILTPRDRSTIIMNDTDEFPTNSIVRRRSGHSAQRPPSYSQAIIRRHTTIRESFGKAIDQSGSPSCSQCNLNIPSSMCSVEHKTSVSPSSYHSGDSSIDSGQCSGDMDLHKSRIDHDQSSQCSSEFQHYVTANLPSYARMASTMDHVLRASSAIYTLTKGNSEENKLEITKKTTVLIEIMRASPCAQFSSSKEIALVQEGVKKLKEEKGYSFSHFAILVRNMVEMILQIFSRIICHFLAEAVNKDRLLVIALEHLIHLLLFGDELCLEAIKHSGIDYLLSLGRMSTTPADTMRLILRTLAVLCGVPKGTLKLLALGGLDWIIDLLCTGATTCAVEAAGVLTQLTKPGNPYVKDRVPLKQVIGRLTDLIDECSCSESLLLCTAALYNLSFYSNGAIDILYHKNIIFHIFSAYNRPGLNSIFVQEQIVSILFRLAASGYEESLIAQSSIPFLLQMLVVAEQRYPDYTSRIRYKSAVCIGILAASKRGLEALYMNNAIDVLNEVLDYENDHHSTSFSMICSNIRDRLENTYQIESAV